MSMKSIEDYIGFSESGIPDAIQNALEKAGNPMQFEVVETLGSQENKTTRQYKVRLKALAE